METLAIEIGTASAETYSLPPHEIKQFYQIAQNGAETALHSLRQFLGANTQINLNCLSLLTLPLIADRIDHFYQNHFGFHLRFSGEIHGEIYAFFSAKDARLLVTEILGCKLSKRNQRFNRIELSVLSELANILANSFWRNLSDKTNLNWGFSPPNFVKDLGRSLFYSAKIHMVDSILLHFEYLIPDLDVRIQMVLLPTQQTLAKISSKFEQAI